LTNRWLPASQSRLKKKPGDRLIGVTINGTGEFIMRAERVSSDTLLAQIVRMVSEAQRSRAPISGSLTSLHRISSRRSYRLL
jgi:cation transport ATPase